MKFLKVILLLIVAFLCLSGCKNSNTTGDEPVVSISGKVIRVLDGDTVKLMEKGTGQEYTIRLYGIDAPEKKQAYGRQAMVYLHELIDDKPVKVIIKDKDKYGRYVAVINKDGIDVNAEMLRAGYAWHYSKYDGSFEYAELMRKAMATRKGLWLDDEPVMPEKFRKTH